jgi:type 1 glutamine amidotransferase
MLGAEFSSHGPQVGVECINEDQKHPACAHLGATWPVKMEEIYLFKNYKRESVHLLLSLDKHPNNQTPGHFPISWNKNYGQGKVFYTSLGHREDVWENADFQKHVLGGIRWSLGLAEGNAEPQATK